MEISALFAPIWRQKWHIILIGIISSLLLLLYSLYLSAPNFYAYVFFTVAYRDEQKPTAEYDYANYYGNYASIEFARTVSAWPKDPYFIKQVYDDAGIDKDSEQSLIDKLLGNFSVTAEQRANLKVNIRAKTEENLRKLTASFIRILQQRLDNYNRQSATQYQLINITNTPYITQLDSDEALPLGLVLGLLLGMVWAYIWEAWQGKLSTAEQVQRVFNQPLFWQKQGADNYISSITTLLTSWGKEVTLITNRTNSKRFLSKLSETITEPTTIITTQSEKLSKALHKNTNITVSSTPPSGKKTGKIIYWIEFPQESLQLIDTESSPVLVLVQRGKSRVHELSTLASLLKERQKEIVLL